MADARRTEARRWLDKAERDLASAVRLLDGDPPYTDTAVYHCQQAAEKAFKAFLAWRERPVRRIHDLVLLVDECEAIDPTFSQLAEAAETLTPYGTAFRYPGDRTEPTHADAHEAIACAERVVATVTRALWGQSRTES